MGVKEKGKQWRHERELCLLVLQWRLTLALSHTHTQNMLVECTAGHWESNAEHTGKADNPGHKQTACQAVAKEVKSHFPWTPPSTYGLKCEVIRELMLGFCVR